jgi:hypothetical protein
MPYIAFTAFGVGVVALAGGVAAIVIATPNVDKARDPEAFQDEAKAAADLANIELGVGTGLLATAGLAFIGGGAAFMME